MNKKYFFKSQRGLQFFYLFFSCFFFKLLKIRMQEYQQTNIILSWKKYFYFNKTSNDLKKRVYFLTQTRYKEKFLA